MPRFLLMPDSFKGTMSSAEICAILRAAIERRFPGAFVRSVPVADGGEGTVDAFLKALGGEKVTLPVRGPFGERVEGFYGLLSDGTTAVIETAASAGLPLAMPHPDPERTTTFGVGELIRDALSRGAKKLILGLGGSATSDMGFGLCAALGARFLDAEGRAFVPVGGTLKDVRAVDLSGLSPALPEVEKVAMCDIDNPLYGQNGAAHVFGPQKGADREAVRRLDDGLRSAAEVLRGMGRDTAFLPGAGAAGGMGAGLTALAGFRLQMGIETVLDTVEFEGLLGRADWVITGEGRLDGQSLRGKVVLGIARRAKPCGVPVLAIVGDVEDGGMQAAYDQGLTAVFPINRKAIRFEEAKLRCREDLGATADDVLRLIAAAKGA